MLWLTADWHVGEDRLSQLQRPFNTAEDHIEFLIKIHNSVVAPDDEVIVVGDCCYFKSPESMKYISHFNGRKTIIKGNHDRYIATQEFPRYFHTIIDEGEGLEMTLDGIPCYLTHYPSQGRKDRFNLVGHVHGAWKYQLNMLNVGVDVHHFYPVPADKIAFHFDAVNKYYDGDIWIAYHDINKEYYGKRGKTTYYFQTQVLDKVKP